MTKKLDKKDWQLLELLCEDARLSHQQIGRKIGLSKNTVTYRIERLQKRGVISGFFAIIDHTKLGFQFYEVLIKAHGNMDLEKSLQKFLTEHGNILTSNRLTGEWDYIIEFGCRDISRLYAFIDAMREQFHDIMHTFEVHPIHRLYKVEQLPIELVKEKKAIPFGKPELVEVDETDMKLLRALSRDATAFIHEIAAKVGVTRETIAARMKKLIKEKILLRTTARINLRALGYDPVLVQMDFAHLSNEDAGKLASFIIKHRNVRYSFMSGASPTVFVYLATKGADTIDEFMRQAKELFGTKLINQKDILLREQYKYDLFPEGFL